MMKNKARREALCLLGNPQAHRACSRDLVWESEALKFGMSSEWGSDLEWAGLFQSAKRYGMSVSTPVVTTFGHVVLSSDDSLGGQYPRSLSKRG